MKESGSTFLNAAIILTNTDVIWTKAKRVLTNTIAINN